MNKLPEQQLFLCVKKKSSMTVTNITNVEKFFETINKCEGKVELITEQETVLI